MTVLVKTLSDLVALFLQVLRFDMLLPSVVLVGLNIAFVWPRFQGTRLFEHLQALNLDLSSGMIAGFAILVVAYALNVLNISIIRLFEGYPWLWTGVGQWLRDSNERRVFYLKREYGKWRKLAENSPAGSPERSKAEVQRNACKEELNYIYPQHELRRILPTRLGNVIACAEQYPSVLYGIDSVALWPYLVPFLQKSGYATSVAAEKSLLDFLLNMSIITLIFGGELLYTDFLFTPVLRGFNFWYTIMLQAVITCFGAYIFYVFAIQGALAWGHTVKVAFTLHKDELREHLGLRYFVDDEDERERWKYAGRFFRDQDANAAIEIFDYDALSRKQAQS